MLGTNTHLIGYTSTSTNRQVAMSFAVDKVPPEHLPVMYHIKYKSDRGLFDMSAGFSAYSDEKEVLLQDGLEYQVCSVDQE